MEKKTKEEEILKTLADVRNIKEKKTRKVGRVKQTEIYDKRWNDSILHARKKTIKATPRGSVG